MKVSLGKFLVLVALTVGSRAYGFEPPTPGIYVGPGGACMASILLEADNGPHGTLRISLYPGPGSSGRFRCFDENIQLMCGYLAPGICSIPRSLNTFQARFVSKTSLLIGDDVFFLQSSCTKN